MGTIADKLEYLSGTKDTIKNAINATGLTVPDGTPFRDYADYISQLTYVPPPQIYGAEWAGTSDPSWMRTDLAADFAEPSPAVNNGDGSSPFDDIMPWSGMEIVEDATAGTLVSIPKYWYKWTRDGVKMKLQISPEAQDGFHVSPAHADRGDGKGERDVVYVGRYHCNTSYKSQAGSQPLGSITRATARSSIHNLGSTYWQYDFAMYWTIMMLYLVEYASWDSQSKIGYGGSEGYLKFNSGSTDNMLFHTGTSAPNRTTYGSVQYRNIEGLWDNVYDWCDGIYFVGSKIYCIQNPSLFSDTSNGTNVGERALTNGITSQWTDPNISDFEYALFPNLTNGSQNTYITDLCFSLQQGTVLNVGSNYEMSLDKGAFFLHCGFLSSAVNDGIGCRLMKLP